MLTERTRGPKARDIQTGTNYSLLGLIQPGAYYPKMDHFGLNNYDAHLLWQ